MKLIQIQKESKCWFQEVQKVKFKYHYLILSELHIALLFKAFNCTTNLKAPSECAQTNLIIVCEQIYEFFYLRMWNLICNKIVGFHW